MANVIETAKASVIAYNEKNWEKLRAMVVEKGVYDEKATRRRLQGVDQIIEAWQGWGKAIPDSKATFVGEYASGDTAILEMVWKGVHTGPLQTPTGTIPPSNKPIEVPACQIVKVDGGKVQSVTTTSTWRRCSGRSAYSRANTTANSR
jgi:SnoaL-like polyketide cyclase